MPTDGSSQNQAANDGAWEHRPQAPMPVIFAKEFFELQLRFAERVQATFGLSLDDVLLEYTNLYVRFGFGRDYDSRHPGWLAFWGLFVDGRGQLRASLARSFLRAFAGVSTGQDLLGCFPFRPQRASAPLADFLRFFALERERSSR